MSHHPFCTLSISKCSHGGAVRGLGEGGTGEGNKQAATTYVKTLALIGILFEDLGILSQRDTS